MRARDWLRFSKKSRNLHWEFLRQLGLFGFSIDIALLEPGPIGCRLQP
jgi:hypothetical protein